MRCELRGDIALRKRWCGAQDQLGTADGFGNVGRHQRQLDIVLAIGVLEGNARAGCTMLCHLRSVAAPQAYLVALQ